jgi:putative endonuclease
MADTLNKIIGESAEKIACEYLQNHGLKFIVANYQCKYGEIDLIMADVDVLVFIEVRHRTSNDYGDGIATVNKGKQRKIIRTATYYLQKKNLYDRVACRFDIVATSCSYYDESNAIKWIKDAFWVKW